MNGSFYNFEKKSYDECIKLLHENKKFKCTSLQINNLTKRVDYVSYKEV